MNCKQCDFKFEWFFENNFANCPKCNFENKPYKNHYFGVGQELIKNWRLQK